MYIAFLHGLRDLFNTLYYTGTWSVRHSDKYGNLCLLYYPLPLIQNTANALILKVQLYSWKNKLTF
jgi:hypothetical protein